MVLWVSRVNAVKVAIQAHRIWIRGKAPFRGAQQHSDVCGVDLYDPRWNAAGFHGFIDGGKDNVAVARDVDDYAAPGKIGDDLIFALRLRSRSCVKAPERRDACQAGGKPKGEPLMIAMIRHSYIVRPESLEPIPGIMS